LLGCYLQIDPDPVPNPAYHLDGHPNPDFYLMQKRIRMRIQIIKMLRILADPDPKYCCNHAQTASN
jgi:hypothetical protein